VRRRPLGRTGLETSEISLGTVELGLDYGLRTSGESGPPTDRDAVRLILHALDLGINLIDTARVYGPAEELVGRAIRGRRDDVVIATKVEPIPMEVDHRTRVRRIEQSVATSLHALGVETIDILQIHSARVEEIQRGETTDVLERLQAAGTVRVIGASTYGTDAAEAALVDGRFGCLQVAYNLLDRDPELGLLADAARAGVGVLCRSVLLRGVLTSRYTLLPMSLAGLRAAIEDVIGVVGSASALPGVAYRYVLADDRVSSALVGTARTDELEAAVRAAAHGPLDPSTVSSLRSLRVSDPKLVQPWRWSELATEAAAAE
jgi:aryl-alcohol dehydrogenase-like predicted oxidoreductase